MEIRFAQEKDIDRLNALLYQVAAVHHEGRPDLFRSNSKKYRDVELLELLQRPDKPILVAVNEEDRVIGYAFCVLQEHKDEGALADVTTLYLDDLCVDETCRGQHIGKALYSAVLDLAKERNCYNVTLNVWSCNESALRFYEACGLKPQKITMEQILTP